MTWFFNSLLDVPWNITPCRCRGRALFGGAEAHLVRHNVRGVHLRPSFS